MLNFLLRSLKYPRAEGFNADDPAQFQAAVVWLENTKVRQYPIDGRAALQSPDPAAWQAALAKYLTDLECPLRPEAGNHRAVLQWLASHAGAPLPAGWAVAALVFGVWEDAAYIAGGRWRSAHLAVRGSAARCHRVVRRAHCRRQPRPCMHAARHHACVACAGPPALAMQRRPAAQLRVLCMPLPGLALPACLLPLCSTQRPALPTPPVCPPQWA